MHAQVCLRDPEPIDSPDYPAFDGEPRLRALDPTEWNMERLNRVSNGAGCVYQIVRGTGPLQAESLRGAVEALALRHPLLGARIVRDGESSEARLVYVRGGEPGVHFAQVEDLDAHYLEIVEADMNAGPSPCWRSSPFRFAGLVDAGDPERWVLVVAGPHAHCDGISLAWLAHELLEAMGTGRVGEPLALRAIEIPPLPERTTLDDVSPGGSEPRMVAPEAEVPAEPGRRALVDTGLIHARLPSDATSALLDASKARGVTVHAAIGAAVHLALATRHAELTGSSPEGSYRVGSPVSMRRHVDPPLQDADLRMAVDVAFTTLEVAPAERFWSMAERFGTAVHHQISTGDILRSWNRTTPRDRRVGSAGVPLALISNVGRSSMRKAYGPLRVEATDGAMATHGMFQINMLFTTFDGRLGACFYFERPTVSSASMGPFVQRVMQSLTRVGAPDTDPTVSELLSSFGVVDEG